jgi:hypothetical protein
MFKIFKTTSVFLVCLFSIQESVSQNVSKEDLQGEWVKNKISLKDGSPIYDESINNSSFGLEFYGDGLIVSVGDKSSITTYTLLNNTLTYRGNHFVIERFDKPILVLKQTETDASIEPIQIEMHFKPTVDLSLVPAYYYAKNEEKVYISQIGIVEPKYLNPAMSSMDYIFQNFRFPVMKKGGFVARFVITKNGTLEGIRIVASSNSKYDDRLVSAIKKTKGKWRAANFQGVPVNCELEYNFDLGYTTPKMDLTEDKKMVAQEYESNAKYYFDVKNYKSVIYYCTKAIENDPYLIDSYYLRAASNVFRKDINGACGDYLQLKNLGQVKATDLYAKYCQDYTPKTEE